MPSPVLRLAVPCFRVSYLWSHALYDEFFVRFACMCDVMQLVRVSFLWYFTISFYWCMNMEQCCRIRLRGRVCVCVCVCVCLRVFVCSFGTCQRRHFPPVYVCLHVREFVCTPARVCEGRPETMWPSVSAWVYA